MHNAGVVVTGGGNGIGRAIAARLAREGARVVVNDLDPVAAQRVAAEIGAYAVPGDAASEEGVVHLIEAAREHLGDIDAYFANAGISRGYGLGSTEAEWDASLQVNLMAHVRAARLLVPTWIESGGGRFVVTASAAGLLTMLGSPTYAVSKHAAVAFAEWLSATYGERGVIVQVLAPQGVDTQILWDSGPLKELLSHDPVLTADVVAEEVWQALQDDRFLILPHAEVATYYAARANDTDRWLRGMRKLQRGLEEA